MRIFPIIPVWIMIIISILLIVLVLISKKKNYIHIMIIILLFIINLRIMIPSNNSKTVVNNLNVLFVVDNTVSMDALDYHNSTRLSGVKNDCKYIIDKLNGSRFSLITFDNTTKIIIPYTMDINTTKEAIDVMRPIENLYAKGSSLNTPYDTLLNYLKSSKKNDKITILYFISDGEITDDSKLKSYKTLSKYIDGGAVLGYGTSKGGYMKNTNEYSLDEYIRDYSSNSYNTKAVSRIDEDNLKHVANDLNIGYIHMNKQDNINDNLNNIKILAKNGIQSNDKSNYDDTYYIFVGFLFILLFIDFDKMRRKLV